MFAKPASLVATAVLLFAGEPSSVAAVDYLGGWLPATPAKQQCVDICVNSKAAPTCLTNAPECLAKKQRPGDFDYLVMEQLFAPQFCRDLLQGVDSTISHQNVLPYPNGVSCKPEVVKSEVTIHGLWPNYNDGYAGCCNVSDSVVNRPFQAAEFAKTQAALVAEMKAKWVDPTQANEYDSLCEIYNHEFQKHGICYSANGDDYASAAVTYFKATLKAASLLDSTTTQINKWAALPKPEAPSLVAIEALYAPRKVQVFCSAVDGKNQLSAIRTCFDKPAVISSDGPSKQIDCAPGKATSSFALCDTGVPISLIAYTAPGAGTPAPTTVAPTTPVPAPTTKAPAPTIPVKPSC
ncbi:Ribonuclease [Globisporangium polare]